MSRIAVVGIGAVGGVVAAALAENGDHDVVACARAPFGQLRAQWPDGRVSRPALQTATEPGLVGPADWVLLTTKTYQTDSARPWLEALTHAGGSVAVLQNGVDQVERVQPLVPGRTVLPVVVMMAAERSGPGRVIQPSPGVLNVADSEAGVAFARLFEGGPLAAKALGDFPTRAWQKLLMNSVTGAVGALTMRPNAVLNDPLVRPCAVALLEEAAAVGRAEGAHFPPDMAERTIERIGRGAPHHASSITVDRQQGRPLEWEARNAIIGQRGRLHGIPTPLNDLATALLAACSPSLARSPS